MSTTERSWTEWFTWHIRQIPYQLHHMRELVDTTISAQDTSAVRVDGSGDKTSLPYRVDPADDADSLYAALVIFARVVAERIGGSSPRPLREHLWNGRNEPQGLPVCTPQEAFGLAAEITRWLESSAHAIAHDSEINDDEPEALVDLIRKMRGRYPRAEPQFKAYRPRPCPICAQRTILPIWGENGLEAMRCDTCAHTWNKTNYPTAGTPTQPPRNASDAHAEPSDTGNTAASPHNSTNTADASSKKPNSSPGGETE